jgi:hypothetical protein
MYRGTHGSWREGERKDGIPNETSGVATSTASLHGEAPNGAQPTQARFASTCRLVDVVRL